MLCCVGLATSSACRAETGTELEKGRRLYASECAACHGASLEGQPRWWEVGASGRLPAPPLDGGGHAWQHSDAELRDVIADGIAGTAAPEYRSDMPAFAGRLDETDIKAVVLFIESRWPDGVRAGHAASQPEGGRAVADLLRSDGDWTFPADCLSPAERAATRAGEVQGGR